MARIKVTPSDGKQDSAQVGLGGQNNNAIDPTTAVISGASTEAKPSVEHLTLSSTPPFLASTSTSQAAGTSDNLEARRLNSSPRSRRNSAPSSGVPPPENSNVKMSIDDPLTTDIEMKAIRPGD